MKKLLALLFAILFSLSINTKAENLPNQKPNFVDASKMNFMKFGRYRDFQTLTFFYNHDDKDSKFIYNVKESALPILYEATLFNSISSGNSIGQTKLQVDPTKLTSILFGSEAHQKILFLGYDHNSDGFKEELFAYRVKNTEISNIMKTELVKYYLDLDNNHEFGEGEKFYFSNN